ncbi:chymotrypsin-1-like [Aphidius gifuensis]|uniref:chymotrypsin-1-like n=1 Tax=Aphidius gifuensis TaxID=684658 RepID=UPI001CDD0D79|nr:chymotrypsin-1-like [Aphidius gifuensis]
MIVQLWLIFILAISSTWADSDDTSTDSTLTYDTPINDVSTDDTSTDFSQTNTTITKKIVNGKWANIGEFPYMVSIRSGGSHSCGGSILDSTHILTAAHCITDDGPGKWSIINLKNLQILTGTILAYPLFPSLYRVKHAYVHENYDQHNVYANDIAILTLEKPISFNAYQKPIPLPEVDVPAGAKVTLSGWGSLSYPAGALNQPAFMRKLETEVISNTLCRSVVHKDIVSQQLCTFKQSGYGACHGDSGGPFVYNNTVVSVISFVSNGCARGKPDVGGRLIKYTKYLV